MMVNYLKTASFMIHPKHIELLLLIYVNVFLN